MGLVTISLPEKLYFYHSTAECFFSGALASLLGYFIWFYNGGPNRFTNIGLGFVFGVGSIFLFFVSSLLMALDDIMRSCRTSILYTDEMASIYASSQPKAAPDVSAAAKAFASAGASGSAKGDAASTSKKIADNSKDQTTNNQQINNNNSDGRIPLAFKGSEMVTGTLSPQTKDSVGAGIDFDQSINHSIATILPSTWDTVTTALPSSWEPITSYDEQTDFYSIGNAVDPFMPYYDYEERHHFTTAQS